MVDDDCFHLLDPAVLHPTLHGDNQEATHINLFMWIRVMLQQLQAEQIHRGAATKLMFESAAAGALTHQVVTHPPTLLSAHPLTYPLISSHPLTHEVEIYPRTHLPSHLILPINSLNL